MLEQISKLFEKSSTALNLPPADLLAIISIALPLLVMFPLVVGGHFRHWAPWAPFVLVPAIWNIAWLVALTWYFLTPEGRPLLASFALFQISLSEIPSFNSLWISLAAFSIALVVLAIVFYWAGRIGNVSGSSDFGWRSHTFIYVVPFITLYQLIPTVVLNLLIITQHWPVELLKLLSFFLAIAILDDLVLRGFCIVARYVTRWKCPRCECIENGGIDSSVMARDTRGRRASALIYVCWHCDLWVERKKAAHRWQFWRKPHISQKF